MGRVAEDGLLALFGVAYVDLAVECEPHGGLRSQAVVVDERLRHAVAETGEEVFKGDVFEEDGEAELAHGRVRDGGGNECAAGVIGLGVDADEVLIRVAKAAREVLDKLRVGFLTLFEPHLFEKVLTYGLRHLRRRDGCEECQYLDGVEVGDDEAVEEGLHFIGGHLAVEDAAEAGIGEGLFRRSGHLPADCFFGGHACPPCGGVPCHYIGWEGAGRGRGVSIAVGTAREPAPTCCYRLAEGVDD